MGSDSSAVAVLLSATFSPIVISSSHQFTTDISHPEKNQPELQAVQLTFAFTTKEGTVYETQAAVTARTEVSRKPGQSLISVSSSCNAQR